ncbi:hypothetical protein KC345_g1428 [Hortaea werneckii]|nr:hypothetical protein KC345_g1428 [Hortaea werneckii]
MSYLADKLAKDGGGESVEFLNNIIAQLWPNINAYASDMIKKTADPMFKQTLPGPLSSMHFTKVDLGNEPIRFSHALSTKTEKEGIKLDLSVDWDGNCDMNLDGDMMPELGVERMKMQGRLSVILSPLLDTMPLVGAAQASLINPPSLSLDFTGAADFLDMDMIDGAVRGIMVDTINSMLTLPNRYLVKLDPNNDYFKTWIQPLGVARITVEKAAGFAEEAKSATKKFLAKITRAAPDCYVKTTVGAEAPWQTATKNNTTTPNWHESHDFIVSDIDQVLTLDVNDEDWNGDDDVGQAQTTVREILAAGGQMELDMLHRGKETGGKISFKCEYFEFEPETGSFTSSDHKGEGHYCGLATVLISRGYDLKGKREELKPSVVITWGDKHRFQTAQKSDAPGTDINNPPFDQGFRIPLTNDLVSKGQSFRLTLMNGQQEVGSVDVPFEDVKNAPNMILENKFDVGDAQTIRASFCLRGLKAADYKEMQLPDRSKQQDQQGQQEQQGQQQQQQQE